MYFCISKALVVLVLHLLSFLPSASAGDAQFYDTGSNLGFALSTTQNATSTDLQMQIRAPMSAGWGAVGIGDVMNGALMFIIYPSADKHSVTVSARTSSGHNTPLPLDKIDLTVQSTNIIDSIMVANVVCRNCTGDQSHQSADASDSKQPWIWATGPGDTGDNAISSDAKDVDLNQHNSYGVFFVDMTATHSNSSSIPNIYGTSDISVKPLPSSVPTLIIIHAICLTGSFLLLFPLGVVALRWFKWVRVHWMLQALATLISLLGLVIAIAFSVMDPAFSTFGEGHQIIGIVVVVYLLAQTVLGHLHHQNYKKVGRRTWISHTHLWMGRLVILLGMLNAVLGFSLAGLTPETIGIAIIAVVVAAITMTLVWFGGKRGKASGAPLGSSDPSSIALSGYNTPRGEDHNARPGYGEGPPSRGEATYNRGYDTRGYGEPQPAGGHGFV